MKTRKIAIISIAALLSACTSKENPYEATGIFEATEIIVSAEQNGRLMQLNVTEGSTIGKDEQVGLIDTVQLALKARQIGASTASIANQKPNINTQIAALRQQITNAEKEQKRFETLVNNGAANRKQLDDATSAVNVLKRELDAKLSSLNSNNRTLNSQISANEIQKYQILDQLKKCHISSPISGTVLEKYAEQGEFATIGKPLFKVADTENVFLRAYITNRQLGKIKIGQLVKVFSDYGDNQRQEYMGKVVWISPRSEFTPKTVLTDDERADQVYAVKIAVKNDGRIKIGMYGGMNI